jgi:hypothetical protein
LEVPKQYLEAHFSRELQVLEIEEPVLQTRKGPFAISKSSTRSLTHLELISLKYFLKVKRSHYFAPLLRLLLALLLFPCSCYLERHIVHAKATSCLLRVGKRLAMGSGPMTTPVSGAPIGNGSDTFKKKISPQDSVVTLATKQIVTMQSAK